jgi:hypothetical protein
VQTIGYNLEGNTMGKPIDVDASYTPHNNDSSKLFIPEMCREVWLCTTMNTSCKSSAPSPKKKKSKKKMAKKSRRLNRK